MAAFACLRPGKFGHRRRFGLNTLRATLDRRRTHRSFSASVVLVMGALMMLLSGCATRPGTDVLVPTAAADVGKRVTVLVATTRTPDAANPTWFTSGRSDRLHYARYVISIPPGHKPSQIEWSKGKPDPKTSFATVEATPLSESQFRRETADRSRTGAAGAADAGIFVHGFNYNFQESLFRAAQLFADVDYGGARVLFAWPSEASPTGYVADKEAATFSRDALVHVIEDVAKDSHSGRIALASHSMGGWLTMEALRQLRLEGKNTAIAKLDEIVLAAPDIDVDVFLKQLEVIGSLRKSPTVLVSKDDGALRLSRFLAGDRNRVGLADIEDPRVQAAAALYKVRVIDISSLASSGDLNHGRYASVAAIYSKLGDRLEGRGRGLSDAGAFVLKEISTIQHQTIRTATNE